MLQSVMDAPALLSKEMGREEGCHVATQQTKGPCSRLLQRKVLLCSVLVARRLSLKSCWLFDEKPAKEEAAVEFLQIACDEQP